MKKSKSIIEIELRGDRLYAISRNPQVRAEIDVTPLWILFKEARTIVDFDELCEDCMNTVSIKGECDIHIT